MADKEVSVSASSSSPGSNGNPVPRKGVQKARWPAKWWYVLFQPAIYISVKILIDPFVPGFAAVYFNGDQSKVAAALGGAEVGADFFAFMMGGWLGRLSDSIGRKWFVGGSGLVRMMPHFIFAIWGGPNVVPLYLAVHILSGLFGVQKSAAAAYLADCSENEHEKRPTRNVIAFAMVLMMAFILLIFIILLGITFEAARWTTIPCFILAIIYMIVLPESLNPVHKMPWKEAKPYYNAIYDRSKIKEAPSGFICTVLMSLTNMAYGGWTSVMVTYAFFSFTASPTDIVALYLAVTSAGVVANYVVTPLLRKCVSDRMVLLIVCVIAAISSFISIFLKNFIVFLLLQAGWVFITVTTPTLIGMVSQEVGPARQGTVIGAVMAVSEMFSVIGSLIFAAILTATITTFPSAFFVIFFIIHLAEVILIIFVLKPMVVWVDPEEDDVSKPKNDDDVSKGGDDTTPQNGDVYDV